MSEPTWWTKALVLERNDELEAAEQLLRTSINHLGCFGQIAHLYDLRMRRKLAEGHLPAAEEAFRKSMEWMRFMASCATSGGEGVALSQQADDHEIELTRRAGISAGGIAQSPAAGSPRRREPTGAFSIPLLSLKLAR